MDNSRRILVTGASGYVGGRLVTALLNEDLPVRINVRDKKKISGQSWAQEVEIAVGNATSFSEMKSALTGIHTAFYLLHSIGVGTDFDELEASMARNFAKAAEAADVKQIVYLGGIANDEKQSKHLASRARTGEELRSTSVPVLELRAGIIIGSGSASLKCCVI